MIERLWVPIPAMDTKWLLNCCKVVTLIEKTENKIKNVSLYGSFNYTRLSIVLPKRKFTILSYYNVSIWVKIRLFSNNNFNEFHKVPSTFTALCIFTVAKIDAEHVRKVFLYTQVAS